MAASTPKVVLNASRDIPFNKLVLSQANVRRINAGVSIEDLAEDIARRGLLQSLNVRPVLDDEGGESGLYEVPAGGRRYRALELLAKEKRLSKTAPVPCIVQAHETAAEEDSLAENIQRVSPHPLDQFRAFRTLREEHGMTDEAIAAAFFITPAVVKQRLRLTAVSPALLDLYAEDAMSLEQLMAFTVTNDHARQAQVWETVSRGYNQEPYLIRRMLTEDKVGASDRRAVLIGSEAYAAAGGTIARDLFQQDHGGWFEDVPLLERLVDERLQAEVAMVTAEGWKWVEAARDFAYGHVMGLRRVVPTEAPLSAEEQARRDALAEEQARLEREYEDAEELPDEVDARLGAIEAELESFDQRPGLYDPGEVVRAGAFVSLSYEGRIRIERGYVRPEDEAPDVADPDVAGHGTDNSPPGGAVQETTGHLGDPSQPVVDEDEGDAGRPLPERLVTELTAHRTLGLRAALAEDPDVALVAVLHALTLRTFYSAQAHDPASCLEVEAKSASLSQAGSGLNDAPAAAALARLHEQWASHLPGRPADLWDFLLDLDADSRASLLAYCVAHTVNAVHEPWNRRTRAMAHATQLAQALRLDLTAQWIPTREAYLARVTKAHILQAVREARGEAAAQRIDHLKKADMAEEAERLLAGTGWLPALLRTPGLETGEATGDAVDGSGIAASTECVELPAFLTGDEAPEQDEAEIAAQASYGIAAE